MKAAMTEALYNRAPWRSITEVYVVTGEPRRIGGEHREAAGACLTPLWRVADMQQDKQIDWPP
jgi:hypothetical protein